MRYKLFFLPHPKMPRPLIMVVCESVPTKESGYKQLFSLKTTLAKYSKLTYRVKKYITVILSLVEKIK